MNEEAKRYDTDDELFAAQKVPVVHYTTPMTDDRVRMIVRDELQRAGLLNSQMPNVCSPPPPENPLNL